MNKVIHGSTFNFCLEKPVNMDVKKISNQKKDVAWHNQDWPKATHMREKYEKYAYI